MNIESRADEHLIQLISDVRARNNLLWMRLVTIAMQHAPIEAKDVLRAINANDRAVSDLLGELAK